MRILFISGSYPPMRCGVGDYTALLANSLANRENIVVSVLSSVNASRTTGSKNTIEVMPVIKTWNIFSLKKLVNIVLKWRPDVVHIQFPTQGYGKVIMPNLLPLILKMTGKPVVQTWHEPPRYPYLLNALTQDALIVVESDYKSIVFPLYRCFLWLKQLVFIPIASNIPSMLLDAKGKYDIRIKFDATSKNLITYFGFASESKGIETIFDIADPEQDRIVLICDVNPTDQYHKKLLDRINSGPFSNKVYITGYLPAEDVARILSAADAIVLPLLKGVAMRNGSFLAAKSQGVFTLTTHHHRRGYDDSENVYYAAPNNRDMMRQALRQYIGSRIPPTDFSNIWDMIADEHIKFYKEILNLS